MYDEVRAELLAVVIEETRRLKRKRMEGASDTVGARFSVITDALQIGSSPH